MSCSLPLFSQKQIRYQNGRDDARCAIGWGSDDPLKEALSPFTARQNN
ncbi:MAG: hypothetical protein R2788_09375 [Saprospiraceae bacterium]